MNCCRFAKAGVPAALGAAVLGGGLLAAGQVPALAQSQTSAQTVPETEGTRAANSLSDAFRRVIKTVQPAVVAVRIETDREAAPGGGVAGLPDIFKNLPPQMREQLGPQMRQFRAPRGNPDIPQQNAGSGVIIDPSGVVLTNNHVVEKADRVYLKLDDGRELQAERWTTDPASDVAVVYLEGQGDLPFVPIGDSDAVEVGDWVLAFGNPFNIGTTVTQGIVSARHRSARLNEREDYLQTDAAINPGNSGGPLVNLRGEIVGVNTAISSRSGGYDGVGFAIPSNMVKWVSDQLRADGKVTRSYLGVEMRDLDAPMQRYYGLGAREGVLVNDVRPGTPAEKAGLQAGDVILSLAGTDIGGGMQMAGVVERLTPGETYPMTVLRDGDRTRLDVTFEAMSEGFYAQLASAGGDDGPGAEARGESVDRLGLEVRALTEEAAKEYGVDEPAGVLVTGVERGTPASRAGLQTGDVIVRVDNRPTLSMAAFKEAVEAAGDAEQVLLAVKRGGRQSLVLLNR